MKTSLLVAASALALTAAVIPASAAVTFNTLDYDVQVLAAASGAFTTGSPGGMGEITSLPSAPVLVNYTEEAGSITNPGTSAAFASAAFFGDFSNARAAQLDVISYGYEETQSGDSTISTANSLFAYSFTSTTPFELSASYVVPSAVRNAAGASMFVLASGTGVGAITLYRGDAYADGVYQSGLLPAGEYEFAAYTDDFSYELPNTTSNAIFEGFSLSAQYALDIAPITAVPEPASWAIMILGIGSVGGFLRSSRRRGKASLLRQS